jgi:N-acetylmuramoyl-L-alanine amidase
MRWIAVVFLAVVAALDASAQASLSSLPRVSMYGHTYVRLEDWARANKFQIRYLSGSSAVYVTNRSTRLRFETDSRRAEVDGVDVYLSVPVAKRSGSAYVGQIDLETALQPILFPPRDPAGKRVKTVCLDAGHGGRDTGKINGAHLEKNYTLKLAQEVSYRLRQAGVNVILTRTRDSSLDLEDRPAIARRQGADLFVSLHFNSFPSREVKGSEVYCMTPPKASSTNARGEGAESTVYPGNRNDERNALLAYQIQKRLIGDLGTEDRGVRRARFAVLREATVPAVLVEGGFMSHPVEGRRITETSYLREMASAIVDGILAYKRLVERSSPTGPGLTGEPALKKAAPRN